MSERVQVLIVDDQPRARRSLKALLATWLLIGEMQEATNGQEAIQSIEQALPDLVLMDVRMPVLDGVRATERIKSLLPESRVIVLTTFDDDEFVFEGLRAGAIGYLLKDVSGHELAEAVRKVAEVMVPVEEELVIDEDVSLADALRPSLLIGETGRTAR